MNTEKKQRSLRHLDVSTLSPTMKALNRHLFEPMDCTKPMPLETEPQPAKKTIGKRRSAMNKTEARFARLLEARKARAEIEGFEYEGITLRWPDGMRYTPDFCVVHFVSPSNGVDTPPLLQMTLCEIKGAYAWAKDVVKFRAARDKWGHLYRFEFWQEVEGEWKETR